MNTRKSKIRWFTAAAVLVMILCAGVPAQAALSPTVGPADPANGFPGWYMDLGVPGVRGPLALAQCLDLNGFCIVLGVAPGPIVFPANFPDEWFYFIAETGPFGTANVFYRTALEAAFAGPLGAVVAGDQSVFTRRRVRADSVAGGTYTATDFYGTITIPGVPAATIRGVNFTEDFGIGIAGNFVLATTGPVGPFVTNTAGPITAPDGNIYISNPGVAVTVTGGPVSNIFTLTGPDGTFTSNVFTIAGKMTSMQVAPTLMKFPPVTPQRAGVDSAPQAVTVQALADLTIPALVTSGVNSNEFRIDPASNTCPVAPVILTAGTTCTFNVIFNGGAAGPADRSASIVIAPTTASAAPATVVLTGLIDAIAPTIAPHFPDSPTAPANVTLTAVFSEVMLASSITNTTFTVVQGTTPVTGTVIFDSVNNTLTFDPTADFTVGAVVTATTTSFITDIAGNPVVPVANWSFTATLPDTVRPEILSTTPANNATAVKTGNAITIKFSEPMHAASLTSSSIIVTTLDGGAVGGTVTYDATTNTATFTPASPLASGTAYKLTITTAADDLAQNGLAVPHTVTFFTNFRPAVPALLSPANGATAVARPVVLTWTVSADQDLDPVTYHLFLCNNPAFVGTGVNCQTNVPITPVAASAGGVYFASVAGGGLLFSLFGLSFAAGIKGRKKILLMIAVLVISGLFVISCSGGGDDGPAPAPTQLSFTVDGLTGGATYYWRIEANDPNGGFAASETQTFTTL